MTTKCTLYLLSLKSPHGPRDVINIMDSQGLKPLLIGRPHFWASAPTKILKDQLLSHEWHVMIFLDDAVSPNFPTSELLSFTESQFCVTFDVSNDMISNVRRTNNSLIHPDLGAVPLLPEAWRHGITPKSAITPAGTEQHEAEPGEIRMTPRFARTINDFGSNPRIGNGAVTMMNLVTINPDGGQERFMEYISKFPELVGEKRKAMGKIVGTITKDDFQRTGWELCAAVHYPTVWHFAEMVTSPEYLEVEERLKKGALIDTCILCVSELDV